MKLLNEIQSFDTRTFGWCMARRNIEQMTPLAKIISKSGDGQLYILFALLLWLFGMRQACFALLCAFTIERIIYLLLKNSFKRNRPAQALYGFKSFIIPSDKFSLPSGHSSAAFLSAGYLTALFPTWSYLYYLWAISVGLSRVFLGVHFPTDVVMGALLGSLSAYTSLQLFI